MRQIFIGQNWILPWNCLPNFNGWKSTLPRCAPQVLVIFTGRGGQSLNFCPHIVQSENSVPKRDIPVVPILSVTSFFLETVSQMLTTSKLSGMVVTSKWLFIHPCAIFIRHLPNPLLQFNKNRVHLLSTLQRAMKMIS